MLEPVLGDVEVVLLVLLGEVTDVSVEVLLSCCPAWSCVLMLVVLLGVWLLVEPNVESLDTPERWLAVSVLEPALLVAVDP
ncbi:MAG: hypothetical protein Q7S40_01080 [Opitutaceae bacterium]|nr:hypothetical protein [Opitutaceae bacterium]